MVFTSFVQTAAMRAGALAIFQHSGAHSEGVTDFKFINEMFDTLDHRCDG